MIKKILLGLVALVVVAIVGVVIVVNSIDFNQYRGEIAAQVQKATGRTLTIKGDLKASIFSLTPSIKVNDVTFANAPWGSKPQMATIGTFGADVQLIPLLSKDIRINRIVLENADILLETDKQGKGNWAFDAPGSANTKPAPGAAPGATPTPAQTSAAAPMPHVGEVVIKNFTLTYRDGVTGGQNKVQLKNLTAKSSSSTSPIDLELEGDYNGQAVKIDGKIGAVADLLAGDKPYPVKLDTKVGNSEIKADLTAMLKGTPKLSGKIDIPMLDIKQLQSLAGNEGGKGAASGGSSSGGSSGGAAKSSGAKGGKLFSEDPIDVSFLRAAEADLNLRGAKIVFDKITAEDLAANINLKGGRLAVKPVTVKLAGNVLNADAVIDGSSGKPAVNINLVARKTDIGALLQMFGSDKIIEGSADVDVALTGAGGSAHAIASGLNGKTSVVMNDGHINNKYLKIAAADLMKVIDPWAPKEDTTKLNCLLSKFDIKSGVATSEVNVVDTAAFSVTAGGRMNLGPETIDMVVDPRPKNQSMMNVAVPIKVTGALADPDFLPDPAAIAKGVMGAAGGYLAGGGMAGVAAGMFGGNKEEAAKNPCVTAVSGKGGQQEPAAKSSGSGVDSTVKGVEKSIKGLFK
ncbi:MAG: AsmA family protein [Alphaproteobacteria bacterium]